MEHTILPVKKMILPALMGCLCPILSSMAIDVIYWHKNFPTEIQTWIAYLVIIILGLATVFWMSAPSIARHAFIAGLAAPSTLMSIGGKLGSHSESREGQYYVSNETEISIGMTSVAYAQASTEQESSTKSFYFKISGDRDFWKKCTLTFFSEKMEQLKQLRLSEVRNKGDNAFDVALPDRTAIVVLWAPNLDPINIPVTDNSPWFQRSKEEAVNATFLILRVDHESLNSFLRGFGSNANEYKFTIQSAELMNKN